MVEDKLSILDEGTVEISLGTVAVSRNLAPKYLRLYSKFCIELNNLILEDIFINPGNFVGKADYLYRPEDKSIPLLMACTTENVKELPELNVHINEKSVLCQSKSFSKWSNVEEIEKIWEVAEWAKLQK